MIWTRSRQRNARTWHAVTRREPIQVDGAYTACGVFVRLTQRENRVTRAAVAPGPECDACGWELPLHAAAKAAS